MQTAPVLPGHRLLWHQYWPVDCPSDPEATDFVGHRRIASYNCATRDQRAVFVVPGAPRVYNGEHWHGGVLPRDDDDDVKPYRFDLEALFRAVKVMEPEHNFQQYDVITGRKNLRMLLGFLANTLQNNERFCFKVHLVGRTALFSTVVDVKQRNVSYGSGKGFEHAVADATGYLTQGSFRMISSCKLGSLRFLIRCEVDAAREVPPAPESTSGGEEEAFDDDPGLEHIRYGSCELEKYNLVELKSKKLHCKPDWDRHWPQLAIGEIAQLIEWAYTPRRGKRKVFTRHQYDSKPRHDLTREEVKERTSPHLRSALAQLPAVLNEILERARQEGSGIIVQGAKGEPLAVYRRDESPLPPELCSWVAESRTTES